jgi:hypothetical protein
LPNCGAAGGARRGIALSAAEPRLETVVTQDAQHILGDPCRGIADKAHTMRREVGPPALGIEDRAVGREIDRVDREVAPRRVLLPAGAEGDAGVASVGLNISAQGRDFKLAAWGRWPFGSISGSILVDDCRHRAVRDPGRHHLDLGGLERGADHARPRRSGEIDIAANDPQQRVAHAAADKPRLDAGRRERG